MITSRCVSVVRALRGVAPALVLAGVGLALAATPSAAVPMRFDVIGDQDSNLRGSVTFAYDAASRRIDITITNTTVTYDDRTITGFAFNLPAAVKGIAGFQGKADWAHEYNPDDIATPLSSKYGKFDLAGLSGASFPYGVADKGIAQGQSHSFSFSLTGKTGSTRLSELDETSFLSLVSKSASTATTTTSFFAVRFQQGGSGTAKDVGLGAQMAEITAVPEPSLLALLGTGLLGLSLLARRRSKRRH